MPNKTIFFFFYIRCLFIFRPVLKVGGGGGKATQRAEKLNIYSSRSHGSNSNCIVKLVTARKQSLGRGNIFSSVCQEFCSQGGVPGQVHPPGRYPHPPGRYTPLEQCMLRDTGNKRAVRILLKCILVFVFVYWYFYSIIILYSCVE